MSETRPPGSYPDPQPADDAPPPDHDPGPGPVLLSAPAPPSSAPAPPGRLRRHPLVTGIALGAVGMLLVGGGVVGGLYLADDEDGSGTQLTAPSQSPSPQEPGPELRPGPPDGGEESPAPQAPPTEDGYAIDMAAGIKIPVPEGWTGQSGTAGGASVSTGEYKCPTAPKETCVRGGVNSAPAAALGNNAGTAKAAAEQDIETNAEESYGEQGYGGITSHEELRAEAVDVAGQEGYLVRWKVVTEEGDDGYVQSLAFPSPVDGQTMVLVRSGFDVSDKAPDLGKMDEITKGIEEAEGGTGGGNPI